MVIQGFHKCSVFCHSEPCARAKNPRPQAETLRYAQGYKLQKILNQFDLNFTIKNQFIRIILSNQNSPQELNLQIKGKIMSLNISNSHQRENSAYLLIKHRKLLFNVTRNELSSRYAGSLLGIGWAVLAPLLIIFIYAVVYLVIFKVKVPSLSAPDYVLYIFSGLVPFLSLSESLGLGVGSIIANKSVLNNTVFPVDLVPAKAVFLSQPTMIVGFFVIITGTVITHGFSWTLFLLPLIWGLQIMGLIGLNWILSLFTVIFRDMQSLITSIIMILMIASPIAYTPDMVSGMLKYIILFNPFAYFVIGYQRVLVLRQIPDPITIAGIIIIPTALFLLGNWLFTKGKRAVADYV